MHLFGEKCGNLFGYFRVAEGIELRQITESEDVEKVNMFWPTHTLNSLCEFKRTVKYYPSVGAYKDGILVSWIIR